MHESSYLTTPKLQCTHPWTLPNDLFLTLSADEERFIGRWELMVSEQFSSPLVIAFQLRVLLISRGEGEGQFKELYVKPLM